MNKLLNYYQHLPERIDPVVFKIGFINIDWYSIGYLAGFFVVYYLLRYRMTRGEFNISQFQISNFKFQIIANFMFYAILGVLIGGRLGYVLFYNLSYYFAHPLEAFLPVQATGFGFQVTGFYGMSFYGGLIGVILAGIIFVKKYKIHPVKSGEAGEKQFNRVNFWQWADFIVPAIPAGYFFGRIGNFFNGELYGRATQKFWGMYFPQDTFGLLRHPSQLYEAFFEGLVLFIILWIFRNRFQVTGYGLCAYLIGYGIFRFCIEFFREPDPLPLGSFSVASPQIGLIFNFLTLGQLFSLAMIAIGVIIFFVRRRKNRYNSVNE